MRTRSISETKRIRYLLGLSSPVERERIESEYFEDEDAFQEMLTAEDDLIDAYARGELTNEERRRFEERFVRSSRGRDRLHFARAFAGSLSDIRSVEPKRSNFFKTFQSPGLVRIAAIAAVIAFVAVLVWLGIDRRRITNELRELRAHSEELSRRTEELQRSSEVEETRSPKNALRALLQPETNQPRHSKRATITTREVRHLPEVKKGGDKFGGIKAVREEPLINASDAVLGNNFNRKEITDLPLNATNVANLLSLQPDVTRSGYVAGERSDQSNITLDGVDVNERPNTLRVAAQNMSSSGGTTVRGTAKDPQGKVVSGATVTLTDPARNFIRTQHTNESGAYVFNGIPPGTYSIQVQAPGFKTALVSGLTALVDTPTVRDVQLEIGDVSDTIAVTAGSEGGINTQDATIGNRFVAQRITELPLNVNNIVGLPSLRPGVSSVDQATITIDGIDDRIAVPSSHTWIRFQIALKTAAIHEDYHLVIKTKDGRQVTSVDWIEPLTPNQTIIDTPAISTTDLPSGDCVLLLMGKMAKGSFVRVAEYSLKVIKH